MSAAGDRNPALAYVMGAVRQLHYETAIEQVSEVNRENGGDQWVKGSLAGALSAYEKVSVLLGRALDGELDA